MDANVNTPATSEKTEHANPDHAEITEKLLSSCATSQTTSIPNDSDSSLQTFPPISGACQSDSHAVVVDKLQGDNQSKHDTVLESSSAITNNEMEQRSANENNATSNNYTEMSFSSSGNSVTTNDEEDDDDGTEEGEGAEYDITTGSATEGSGDGEDGGMSAGSMLHNMSHHSFDDIQFFPSSHHRSLRLQPQFQFHHDQFNDPNFHSGQNLSCFDASDLVNLSGSGGVSSFSFGDSTSGDINSAFSESPFVFPDNVMEYGEPQFFPGNCVGYLETILEEDDEEYEEEEGCSGRHWWTADSDTDTDSVIRVDNHGQAKQQQKSTSCQQASTPGHAHGSSSNTSSVATISGASREMLDEDMLQLDCKVPCYTTVSTSEIPTSAAAASTSASIVTSAGSPATAKARSLTNLSTRLPLSIAPSQFEESTGDLSDSEERAKSLEFLLDDNHKSSSVPPENKLRLETRQLSEHELRIQRSLQRLNLPEWYKQHGTLPSASNAPTPATASVQRRSGTLNTLRRSEYGSSGGLAGGWSGLSTYKAPSMSSLQSNGGRNSATLNKNFVRGRPVTMSVTRTSKESLLATGSASHSPSAFERSSFTYGMPFTMTRFGQGRLSTHSTSVSPPSTPDSTTKPGSYVKKPYLGWRSQEKLNAAAAAAGSSAPATAGPPKLSIYLPPAERLAAEVRATRAKSPNPPVRPPLSDRPPLPKAPPRSDKTVLSKSNYVAEDSNEAPGARSSSPVISKQTSSLAIVTKLPQSQQSNSIPPPEFSQGNYYEGIQSQNRNQIQSARVTPDVHDSIRQVTSAISHYVNRGSETQSQQKVTKPKSGKKQAIWIESSFVGQKPPTN